MRGFATVALICGLLNFVGYAAALAYVGVRYALGM
jgi:hypothetical protein